jgi:hypothetical protein
MTSTKRATLQAVGLAMFLGVLIGAATNGNPFGAITYVLAVLGLGLWVAMTFAVRPRNLP